MKKFIYLLIFFLTLSIGYSQSDLQVYGFFQPMAMSWDENFTFMVPAVIDGNIITAKVEEPKKVSNFGVQQANLMARNNFGDGFSAFVNLEFTNNYSSSLGWGDLSLQEAFLRYEYRNYLNIKVGNFIPAFNNMYEIYNRTPLLPFIFRPYVYETLLKSILNNSLFLPPKAFVQIDGNVPLSDANFDYAIYLGNSENSYIQNSIKPINELTPVNGMQLTNDISIGGRVGIRTNKMKAGISLVLDKVDLRKTSISEIVISDNPKDMGTPLRYRLGADLNYSIAGFTLTGEMIYAVIQLNDSQKDSLKVWSQFSPDLTTGGISKDNLNGLFYFVTLQYDINQDLFAYGTYQTWINNKMTFVNNESPLVGMGGGLGYKFAEQVVVKAQYQNNKITGHDQITPTPIGNALFNGSYESNFIMFAVSVAF